VDVCTPATKDQDSPLATENGPMQGIPANESATAIHQDEWKGDIHGSTHFHFGPTTSQARPDTGTRVPRPTVQRIRPVTRKKKHCGGGHAFPADTRELIARGHPNRPHLSRGNEHKHCLGNFVPWRMQVPRRGNSRIGSLIWMTEIEGIQVPDWGDRF
jgi:hypothetical protein